MELPLELQERIVLRHRSGEGYQNISAALKVPKNTVNSITLKWKKFVATKPLPRAGRPGKLSNRGRRSWLGRWPRTRWSLWQSSRVPLWSWENLPEGQPSQQHSTIQARQKPLLSKRHTTACLEFSKRHLNDSQIMRNKILWSDETKIELFGLNAKRHVWRKPGTITAMKHGGGRIMLWGCFSEAGTGRLVRIERKMNGAKYREILDENLLQGAQDLRLGWRFTFQQDNNPKHTAKTTQEWLWDKSLNVIEWPSQSLDLNPIEHLWRDLKMAVQQRFPSNLTELERICREEWEKLSKYRCAKLVASYPRRL